MQKMGNLPARVHVAVPRGRARWPAWQAMVTRVILYRVLYIYNIYSIGVPRVYGDNRLISLNHSTIYTECFPRFIQCGTKLFSFI